MNTFVQLKTPSRLIASTLRQDAWSILTKVLSELSAVRPLSFIRETSPGVGGQSSTPCPAGLLTRSVTRFIVAVGGRPAEERHGVRRQAILQPKALRHAGEPVRHARGDRG